MAGPVDADARTHEWYIEEREYARQESRRGRRHAFARLTPERTALIVIDMVPFFALENRYCRGIVPNINRLARALRAVGGLVVWVLPGGDGRPTAEAEEFSGAETARMFAASGGEGPLRQRLWSELGSVLNFSLVMGLEH